MKYNKNTMRLILSIFLCLLWITSAVIQVFSLMQLKKHKHQNLELVLSNSGLLLVQKINEEILSIPAGLKVTTNFFYDAARAIKKWQETTEFSSLFKHIIIYRVDKNRLIPSIWDKEKFTVLSEFIEFSQDDLNALLNKDFLSNNKLQKLLALDRTKLNNMTVFFGKDESPLFFFQIIIDEDVLVTQFLPTLIKQMAAVNFDFNYCIKNRKTNKTLFKSDEDFYFDKSTLSFSFNFLSENTEFFSFIQRFQSTLLPEKTPVEKFEKKSFYSQLDKSLLLYAFEPFHLLVSHKEGSVDFVVMKEIIPLIVLTCFVLVVLLIGSAFFVHYIKQIQDFSKRQQEFIATVTHELKTPIAVVSAAGQNMASGIINKPDKIVRYGLMLDKESRRLKESIDYYLLYSNIVAVDKIKKKECDIVELVDSTLSQTLSVHAQIGFQFEIDLSKEKIFLFCDEIAIVSVVQNLATNAIKHASEGKYLKVKLTKETLTDYKSLICRKKKQKDFVCIRFIDKGRGIPKHEQKIIFEPFQRGTKANSQQIDGSGIGLNLVKRIIKLHGGEIKIEKSNSGGTTFLVTIPLDDLKK
ncbi:MAG: sensor histidine kinase [Treponemataceae bacterium]